MNFLVLEKMFSFLIQPGLYSSLYQDGHKPSSNIFECREDPLATSVTLAPPVSPVGSPLSSGSFFKLSPQETGCGEKSQAETRML